MADIASEWMEPIKNSTASVLNILDWDDVVVARIPVPGDLVGEERLVYLNAWVRDNLFHPDLRNADRHSRAREESYRGKYPYEFGGTYVDNAGHTEETYEKGSAEHFPLTNKLDYKYVTSPMVMQSDGRLQVQHVEDDPYPYLRGLMMVHDPINTPWTTIGTAELASANYRDVDGVVHEYDPRRTEPLSPELTPTPTRTPSLDANDNPYTAYTLMDELNAYLNPRDITLPEDRLIRLQKIAGQWDDSVALRTEFLTAFGETDPRVAAHRATGTELQRWMERALSVGGIKYVMYYTGRELARRVVELEARNVMRIKNFPSGEDIPDPIHEDRDPILPDMTIQYGTPASYTNAERLLMIEQISDAEGYLKAASIQKDSYYANNVDPLKQNPIELVKLAKQCIGHAIPSMVSSRMPEWDASTPTGTGSLYEVLLSEMCDRYSPVLRGFYKQELRRKPLGKLV